MRKVPENSERGPLKLALELGMVDISDVLQFDLKV